MNSSDLPITEWWDPEYDVWDVPGSPYDAQAPGEMAGDLPDWSFAVWWAAYDHVSEVGYIMTGERWYAPPNLYAHQLEARAYPGQPTHHSAPPVRPCSCAYHVVQTPADGRLIVPTYHHSPGLTLEDEHDEGAWFYSVWFPRCPVLSWFTIRRSCPHHGAERTL